MARGNSCRGPAANQVRVPRWLARCGHHCLPCRHAYDSHRYTYHHLQCIADVLPCRRMQCRRSRSPLSAPSTAAPMRMTRRWGPSNPSCTTTPPFAAMKGKSTPTFGPLPLRSPSYGHSAAQFSVHRCFALAAWPSGRTCLPTSGARQLSFIASSGRGTANGKVEALSFSASTHPVSLPPLRPWLLVPMLLQRVPHVHVHEYLHVHI